MTAGRHAELGELLEALCEERISAAGLARLEQLALSDRDALRFYLDYIQLHGTLLWDTAKGGDAALASPLGAELGATPPELDVLTTPCVPVASLAVAQSPREAGWLQVARLQAGRGRFAAAALAAALLVAAGAALWSARHARDRDQGPNGIQGPNGGAPVALPIALPAGGSNLLPEELVAPPSERRKPLGGAALAGTGRSEGNAERRDPSAVSPAIPTPVDPKPPAVGTAGTGARHDDAVPVVAFVDAQLRAGWEAADVAPSPRAEDSEWVRRAHLDLVGRVPTADVVERFLKDANPRKQLKLIDDLLDDPRYVRNWTTIWTNLLVGRSTSRDAQRTGLQKFLREAFAHNRPWKDVVFDLVSAEGSAESNGAAGFLLAHLNNQAVPATAITARVLLGTQVQCTQCHNHPFNDAKQNEFWELNSFFQQTARVDRPERDLQTGKTVRRAALVNKDVGGPIFFESRSALMRAAFPKFDGRQIDPSPQVNRRRELARLMAEDDQAARSFVNRMWEHFFGAGFTRPVDDMGPHNPSTHPAALERLTAEFVKSGHDVKQLLRWICQTEAYQRSSRFSEANGVDDPAVGNPPLFSRAYVKSMTAEQLYDSLLVATRAEEAPRAIKLDLDRQRDEWIQQFVVEYATEENDEALTFDGTIPQALMMMNSELVSSAVSDGPGTLLHDVLRDRGSETDKIRRLSLAALSRYPTAKETAALRKALRDRPGKGPRPAGHETAAAEGLQDVFWALLNSNEFVLVH